MGVGLSEQTSPYVELENPTLHGRRQSPCALGIEPDRPVKTKRSIGGVALPREQPVGDRHMEMGVRIEAGAEAVQKGDGAQAGITGYSTTARGSELAADSPNQDTKHRARQLRVLHEVGPQPLGDR